MKKYFIFSILFGLIGANFTSTLIQAMEINRIKNSSQIQFLSQNIYPIVFCGAVLVAVHAAKVLFNCWKDRERTYEIDEMTNVVISKWPLNFPQEYIAVIKNRKTNESYGHLIYQLQDIDVAFIRRFEIERAYREKGYGSKLLKIVLNTLPSLHGCTKVTLFASPIALKSDETKQELLPKLIAFYQKQGAQIDELKNDGAWMVFDLKFKTDQNNNSD